MSNEITNFTNISTLTYKIAKLAVVISFDRIFTHIIALEGNSERFVFNGLYSEYEENKKIRLGNEEKYLSGFVS